MNTPTPQISIILPTHNRADVLPFAIGSILQQTVNSFELLVVGDGCTDHTAEVVKGFADGRIQWLDLPKAPNFGYANRNIAFKQAKGEFIAFMAHDDLVFPDHLETLLKGFTSEAIDLTYTRPLWISRNGTLTPSYFNLNRPELLKLFLSWKAQEIPASCVMHRRSCFERVGYWDENRPEAADWDLWIRIILHSEQPNFTFIPTPTNLHFLASWRKVDQIPGGIFRCQKRAELEDPSFPTLKIPIPAGVSEQEALWNLMNSSDRWVSDLRREVLRISDEHIGWAERRITELTSQAEVERVRHNTEHAGLLKAIQEQEHQISSLQSDLVEAHGSLKEREAQLSKSAEDLTKTVTQLEDARHGVAVKDWELAKIQLHNLELAAQLSAATAKLYAIENSKGWRLLNKLREIRHTFLSTVRGR